MKIGNYGLVIDGLNDRGSELKEVEQLLLRYEIAPFKTTLKAVHDALPHPQEDRTPQGSEVLLRIDDAQQLRAPLSVRRKTYSHPSRLIYVGCHYARPYLHDSQGNSETLVYDLARHLNEHNAIAPGGTLFIAGCRAGGEMEAVAAFSANEEVEFYCGCEYITEAKVFSNAIENFVYRMMHKNDAAPTAAKVATLASGLPFKCYSRSMIETKYWRKPTVQKLVRRGSVYDAAGERTLFSERV